MLPRFCYTSAAFFEFEREAVFARSWVYVGRTDQLPEPGDCLSVSVAGEPLIVARTLTGDIRAMGAVSQHRGHVMACDADRPHGVLRCPLHFWTYDLEGRLVGAPRMGEMLSRMRDTGPPAAGADQTVARLHLRQSRRGRRAARAEPRQGRTQLAGLSRSRPRHRAAGDSDDPMPWNWKLQLENLTDAYHPEFVHQGTHDFAPSVHPAAPGDGVAFTPMRDGDNAFVRSVPMLRSDGGMMRDGWGAEAMFPPIQRLSPAPRRLERSAHLVQGPGPTGIPSCIRFAALFHCGSRLRPPHPCEGGSDRHAQADEPMPQPPSGPVAPKFYAREANHGPSGASHASLRSR